MPDEGAVEGGRGPEHELGFDAQLKQVSQVLVVGEFKRLREAEFNGVLAFLHLAFSQGQFQLIAYVDDQRILKIELTLLYRTIECLYEDINLEVNIEPHKPLEHSLDHSRHHPHVLRELTDTRTVVHFQHLDDTLHEYVIFHAEASKGRVVHELSLVGEYQDKDWQGFQGIV